MKWGQLLDSRTYLIQDALHDLGVVGLGHRFQSGVRDQVAENVQLCMRACTRVCVCVCGWFGYVGR